MKIKVQNVIECDVITSNRTMYPKEVVAKAVNERNGEVFIIRYSQNSDFNTIKSEPIGNGKLITNNDGLSYDFIGELNELIPDHDYLVTICLGEAVDGGEGIDVVTRAEELYVFPSRDSAFPHAQKIVVVKE